MDKTIYRELWRSAGEALDHAGGKRELRTTVLPPAPEPMSAADVRRLRDTVNCSQAVFAQSLNVSTKLVQAWESRRRRPEGPALLLLRLFEREPSLALSYATAPPPKGRRVAETVLGRRKHGARKAPRRA